MAAEHLSQKVGVVGLGLMGTAITERLLNAGFAAVVWNRTRDKADWLVARGAQWSDNPLAACDRVIISLFSSDVVSEVLEPRLASIRPRQILIDTTTGDPASSKAWERRLQSLGAAYLDAPISGSSEQTRRGEATVIASGDRDAFDACRDLWPVLGGHVFHVGPCGSAAKMKLVSNLVLGLNRAALAEGLALAESLGLDLPMALEVLRQSAAYSRQMDTKGRKMIDRDFAPQARLSQHLKDVRLMLVAAEQEGLSLPLSAAHRDLLARAESLGLGDLDNSAVVEAVRRTRP
jgi:3-hydroxyisobutyrate dehydrogenase-like beta-hydroxyacid dehydrogenase